MYILAEERELELISIKKNKKKCRLPYNTTNRYCHSRTAEDTIFLKKGVRARNTIH